MVCFTVERNENHTIRQISKFLIIMYVYFTICVSNSMEQDQTPSYSAFDLAPNCLQRFYQPKLILLNGKEYRLPPLYAKRGTRALHTVETQISGRSSDAAVYQGLHC